MVLGAVSYYIEASLAFKGHPMPGVALQAVSLTCGTLFCMLFAYGSGLIRVTDKLRMGITAATGAIALVYVTSMILGFFGYTVPFLRQANPIGIGIGFVIVGVAAFNLLLDFDFIDQCVRRERRSTWNGTALRPAVDLGVALSGDPATASANLRPRALRPTPKRS